jgi:hypothetical protein
MALLKITDQLNGQAAAELIYSNDMALKDISNTIIGKTSAVTINPLASIVTPSTGEVPFVNNFDASKPRIVNRALINISGAGSIIMVKSFGTVPVFTELATFTVVAGLNEILFADVLLAIGERIGFKPSAAAKVTYIGTVGVGYFSTNGVVTANGEIGYQLFGVAAYAKSQAQLTDDIARIIGSIGVTITSRMPVTLFADFVSSGGGGTTFTNTFATRVGTDLVKTATFRLPVSSAVNLYRTDIVGANPVLVATFVGLAGINVVDMTSYNIILKGVERLAIKTASGIYYTNTNDVGFYDGSTNSFLASRAVAFGYDTVPYFTDLSTLSDFVSANSAALADLQKIVTIPQPLNSEVVFYEDKLTADSVNWTKTGWTFAANKFTSSAQGVDNRLEFGRSYWSDKRASRMGIIFNGADTDLRFHTKYGGTGLGAGVGASMFGINLATAKLTMYKANVANAQFTPIGVTTTPHVEVAIPFVIVPGRLYYVDMEKNNVTQTITLRDTVTGLAVSASVVGEAAGRQNERYGLFVNAGASASLTYFKVVSTVKDVKIVLSLDSITEGKGATNPDNRYASVIRNAVPKSVICARGGATVADFITQYTNEISFLKPAIIMLMGGANGGVTQAQIDTIKALSVKDKFILYWNRCPCLRTTDEHIAINALLDANALRGIKMDVATALQNYPLVDGTHPAPRANPVLYDAPDLVHQNDLGYIEINRRISIDTPELITGNGIN